MSRRGVDIRIGEVVLPPGTVGERAAEALVREAVLRVARHVSAGGRASEIVARLQERDSAGERRPRQGGPT